MSFRNSSCGVGLRKSSKMMCEELFVASVGTASPMFHNPHTITLRFAARADAWFAAVETRRLTERPD